MIVMKEVDQDNVNDIKIFMGSCEKNKGVKRSKLILHHQLGPVMYTVLASKHDTYILLSEYNVSCIMPSFVF